MINQVLKTRELITLFWKQTIRNDLRRSQTLNNKALNVHLLKMLRKGVNKEQKRSAKKQ